MGDDYGARVLVPLRSGLLALLVVAGATVGFHDLFIGSDWIAPVAVAVLGAVALTVLWRLLALPTLAGVVLTLGLGASWLLAWFPLAAGLAWRDRPAAVWDGVVLARMEIAQQVAPTPLLTGMTLLLAVGCFVVATAVTELLSRDLALSALMVAIVLWVAPLTIPLSERSVVVASLAFALPAVVVLAGVDDPVVGRAGQSWRRRSAGLAVAVAVAVLAVPLAVRIPGHGSTPVFDLRGLGTTIQGYEPIVDVGDQLRLPGERVVMQVETARPAYLRTAALEVFDGRRWRVGRSLEETTIPDGAYEDPTNGIGRPGPATNDYAVEVVDLPNVYLPVPNRPVAVTPVRGPAALTYSRVGEFVATDSMTALSAADRSGADYVAAATIPSPSYDEVAGLEVDPDADDVNVQLPVDEPQLQLLAEQVVAEAGADDTIERVLAVQDHFAGPDSEFTYSTDVPELAGDTALRDFVLSTRTGYCEYFATAMAVMLRSLDIPTRVATGYLPGQQVRAPEEDGEPGLYQVSTTDAHAWVEVHFPGHGWLTFDPTPRSDTSGLRPDASNLTPFGPNGGSADVQDDPRGFTGENNVRPVPPSEDLNAGARGPLPIGPGVGETSRRVVPWLLLGLVVLVLAGLAAAWWFARRVPEADEPDETALLALAHLLRGASALGCGRAPDETLHELTRRWVRQRFVDERDAAAIADIGSRAAFGSPLDPDEARTLRAACHRVGEHLRQGASMPDRVLAGPRWVTAKP